MSKKNEKLKVDHSCEVPKRSDSAWKTRWEVLIFPFLRPTYDNNLVVVVPSKENHSTLPYKVEPNI